MFSPEKLPSWDCKLSPALQKSLNDLRLNDFQLADTIEHQVRESFRSICTDLETLRRMYRAAQNRCDEADANLPNPFDATPEQKLVRNLREEISALQQSLSDVREQNRILTELVDGNVWLWSSDSPDDIRDLSDHTPIVITARDLRAVSTRE